MKRGGCKFGDDKTRDCPLPKWGGGGAVSKSVPKLKDRVGRSRQDSQWVH